MASSENKLLGDHSVSLSHIPQQNVQPNLYQQAVVAASVNNPPAQTLFMNPHAAAQAATAAFAAAAQQVAHAQIQNSGHSNVNNVNVHPIPGFNTTGISTNPDQSQQRSPCSPSPQPNNAMPQQFTNSQQQQQIQLSAQALSAQAQAAAILAAGGINPALLFNAGAPGPSPQAPNALAAAQVVASLLQSQSQQHQQHQQQQQQQQHQPNINLPSLQDQTKSPQIQQQQQVSQMQHVNHVSALQQPTQPISVPYVSQNHVIAGPPVTTVQPSFIPKPFPIGNLSRNVGSSSVVKQPSIILHGSNPMSHPQAPPPQPSPSNAKNGLYAAAAAAANNPILLAQMQNWKLDQLEAHVNLLRDANQPVPQPISLLLAEARRREEKRTAKRVANRKSACTSRARKKALVEEMTRTNAKLRRQAMILALLPDLVIAIKVDGEITFCSAQVERVLRHKIDDMVGANILQLLLPSCRESLFKLVERLLAAATEQAALDDNHKCDQIIGDEGADSANSAVNRSGGAAVVSDPSEQGFPTVVKVQSRSHSSGTVEDASDMTGNADMKSPTRSLSLPDELNSGPTRLMSPSNKGQSRNKDSSSSGGDESSTSAVAKQLNKANEALDSNVRRHNAQLMCTKEDFRVNKLAHKDDVTGASVTANNAGARLSSLQVNTTSETLNDTSSSASSDSLFAGVEDKRLKASAEGRDTAAGGDTSDDSGYRESGESDPSREDSASSTSGTSNDGSSTRPRPLAPTCNITLIRDDLTTILCEVTSSIRTRSLSDENCDAALLQGAGEKISNASDDTVQGGAGTDDLKELLLCLRPIRDGEETLGEDLRFVKTKFVGRVCKKNQDREENKFTSDDNATAPMVTKKVIGKSVGIEHSTTDAPFVGAKTKTNKVKQSKSRPMKKRPLTSTIVANTVSCNVPSEEPVKQKMRTTKSSAGGVRSIDAEKSVVESLMLMSSHRK